MITCMQEPALKPERGQTVSLDWNITVQLITSPKYFKAHLDSECMSFPTYSCTSDSSHCVSCFVRSLMLAACFLFWVTSSSLSSSTRVFSWAISVCSAVLSSCRPCTSCCLSASSCFSRRDWRINGHTTRCQWLSNNRHYGVIRRCEKDSEMLCYRSENNVRNPPSSTFVRAWDLIKEKWSWNWKQTPQSLCFQPCGLCLAIKTSVMYYFNTSLLSLCMLKAPNLVV